MLKFLVSIVIAAGILTSTSGCFLLLVGAGGAAGVGYVMGDLEATVQHDLKDVYQASLRALGQLELPILSKTKTVLNAEIRSINALDKKVKIILKRTETDNTQISIRIGTFGDETHSRQIYNKIVANL